MLYRSRATPRRADCLIAGAVGTFGSRSSLGNCRSTAFNLQVELAIAGSDELELIAWLVDSIERQEWSWETLSIAIQAIETNYRYRYNPLLLDDLAVNLARSQYP